jgi:hypothetical protein
MAESRGRQPPAVASSGPSHADREQVISTVPVTR